MTNKHFQKSWCDLLVDTLFTQKYYATHILTRPMTLRSEHVSVNISLWTRTNIFGVFWWWGHNIFRISPCHVGMMWKIFCHMYMDESHKRMKKWMKVEQQRTFWMINITVKFFWMKIHVGWNLWMKFIPKQLCQTETTWTCMKITKWIKYLDESWTSMNCMDDKWK